MKKIIFLLFFLICTNLFSQNAYTISGSVVDENNEAIPYAIISVLSYDKTKIISQTSTDWEGNFILKGNGENLKLIVIANGFESYEGNSFLWNKNILLPVIKLKSSVTELSSVTISANRKTPPIRL